MTVLTVYPDQQPQQGKRYTDFADIHQQLAAISVQIERWTANTPLAADADQSSVIAAYADSVERLQKQYGFQSVDVVKLTADNPDKEAFRQKFLSEHTHDDFEVRFFVEGRGLFYLHVDGQVFAILCEQGDLISVPGNTTHWFDMGENPHFTCIRLFTKPDGWIADFTGSDIATTFPTLDQYVAELA
ncbi:MAG: cupin [Methylococcaceae bacterium]|nr:cupin [Methylococcaceae bacterium]MDZ4154949.1 cupin [Methylococcales bacterium]MDP2392424.1 cupin [Methylococcaceae bacterium]MDP3019530.1 cupin [Methylococcaceae bacterium]MDP3389246.1 cupin [Methylococcaceae bacterium]